MIVYIAVIIFCTAAIAQLGERQTEDLKVPGSIRVSARIVCARIPKATLNALSNDSYKFAQITSHCCGGYVAFFVAVIDHCNSEANSPLGLMDKASDF